MANMEKWTAMLYGAAIHADIKGRHEHVPCRWNLETSGGRRINVDILYQEPARVLPVAML